MSHVTNLSFVMVLHGFCFRIDMWGFLTELMN